MPAIVDLAAMRDAMDELGGDPAEDQPAGAGRAGDRPLDPGRRVRRAPRLPAQRRARVRAQPRALRLPALGPEPPSTTSRGAAEHRHLPPGQPRVPRRAWSRRATGRRSRDTLVGTDSHTTMINGLGVLGWGVGGIEAEAAMLGQPVSMLIPQVVGFRLTGELPEGVDRHRPRADRHPDAARARRGRQVRRVLRARACPTLPLADRATIGNMAPEYGATCGIFPVDAETLRYLEFSGRPRRAGGAGRGLLPRAGPVPRARTPRTPSTRTRSSSTSARSCRRLAGPKRPQDRVALADAAQDFLAELRELTGDGRAAQGYDEASAESFPASDPPTDNGGGEPPAPSRATTIARRRRPRRAAARGGDVATAPSGPRPRRRRDRRDHELHEHLEPVGDARRRAARQEGGRARPRAPAVGQDLARAGLQGGHRVPRARRPDRAAVAARLRPRRATAAPPASATRGRCRRRSRRRSRSATWWSRSVLSGNRNFEGRIHPEVKMNYLASPPLCVAYALAGRMDLDLLQRAAAGRRLPARHLALASEEVSEAIEQADRVGHVPQELRRGVRGRRDLERRCDIPEGDRYAWDDDSTYVKPPALLRGHGRRAARGLRADRGRPRAGAAGRQRHHRPHLAGRRDQEGLARRRAT